MKKRIPICIISVVIVVACAAVLLPSANESNPMSSPSDNDSTAVPISSAQGQDVNSLIREKVAAYEEAIDVLYNRKGNDAVSRLEEIESRIEEIDAKASVLDDTERQKMNQHPDILEVKKKYDTAVERVKLGASAF